MNPGIYENITNEAYHASQGISRSGIMAFRKSPLHYWNDYINPEREVKEPTRDMILGSAFHALCLEPDTFLSSFIKKEEFGEKIHEALLLKNVGRELFEIDKKIQAGYKKRKIEFESRFLQRSEGKTILNQDEYEKVERMHKSIFFNPEARDIIKSSSYEHSIYWNDPFTNVLCKARPDIMCENYIADIKTTDDASPESFRFSIRKYGYHIQAAMLLDGMNAIKGTNCNNFIIIAIEKKPPYAVAVYVLYEAAIDSGREIYKSSLVEYKKCLDENKWPSYQTQVISI